MHSIVKYIEKLKSDKPGYEKFKFRKIQFPQYSCIFEKKEVELYINKEVLKEEYEDRKTLYLNKFRIDYNGGYVLEVAV